jgi:cyclopropane-fatty-acyl-phospholipid synthase
MHTRQHPWPGFSGPETTPATNLYPREASWFEKLFAGLSIPGEIVLPDSRTVAFGEGAPRFRITVHNQKLLRRPHDEFSLGQAYVNGELDLEGDMLAILEVRRQLAERFRVGAWLRLVTGLFLTPDTREAKRVIDRHYTFGNDFYFSFLDTAYRFYSHCLFARDDETLEAAAERKLQTTFQALDLAPGMRLLDIGAGWGGTFQYCCPRGVQVTGVTLFENSCNYINELIRRDHLDGKVFVQDFLTYEPDEPFDAIVTYGVIEHIPNYRKLFTRAWACLKPGGKIYIDGSATKEKHSMSQFARRYIWQGAHSCMCLPETIQEALYHGFQVIDVKEESHDYELTMLHWAQRLDRHRKEIVARWGEELYRVFRIFLWGGVAAFRDDQLQAYHLVLRRGQGPGPRPGWPRRVATFIKQMA